VLIVVNMKTSRPYEQTARRAATAQTRAAILDAGLALSREKLSVEIVLSDIAERANVSVQTVLRHFSSREGLFDALHAYGAERVREQRRTPTGHLDDDMRVLVEHYEQWGDLSISLLAQENTDPHARAVTTQGRALHRSWVEHLVSADLVNDVAVIDELVVVTDVYCWKLLRRDRGLSVESTYERMLSLAHGVLQHHRHTASPTPRRDTP